MKVNNVNTRDHLATAFDDRATDVAQLHQASRMRLDMNMTNASPKSQTSSWLGRNARFCLSARGHSTAADYRAQIAMARGRGSSARAEFELARISWAHTHGLEADDGAYLGEMRECGRTLVELCDGLIVCGQTRDMVSSALTRLIARGVVERVAHAPNVRRRPTREAAEGELTVAQHELESLCVDRRPDPRCDRWMVDDSLRRAASRVVAARKFLASFPAPG